MEKAHKIDGKYWRTALNDRDKARREKKKPKLINGKKPLDHAMDEIERKMKEKDTVKKKKKDVVEDVLDDNYEAEVDADRIPTNRSGVLWKKDANKKGVKKLKSFIKQRKK